MGHETVIRPDEDLAALAERAAAGERIVLLLPNGTRVELQPRPAIDDRPDPVVDPKGLKWLDRHRVGKVNPRYNSVDLVRADRDGDDLEGSS